MPPATQQYGNSVPGAQRFPPTPLDESEQFQSFEQQADQQPAAPSRQNFEGVIMLEEGKPTGSSVIEPDSVLADDGRTYHGYDEGTYFLPNDGEEQDRLDLQHAMCHLLLDGQFGLAPFKEPPREVLDIATGTGIWALEYARQNPSSHVVGTDLSLIQPTPDVPNCEFIRENSETSEWIFPYCFDYAHIRYSATCFDDPLKVLQKAFDHLKPGGWLELFDPTGDPRLQNDPEKKCAQYRWFSLVDQAMLKFGRDPYKARQYKTMLQSLGFIDVQERLLLCPTSPWVGPKNRRMEQLGRFYRASWKRLLTSGTSKFFHAVGMSDEEQADLNSAVRKELDEEKVQVYMPYFDVYGRKPLESEMTDTQKAAWEAMKQKVASRIFTYPTPE